MTPERVELMLSRWGAWRVAGAAGGIGYPRAAAFARLVPGTPGPMVLLHDRDREAEQFDVLMRLVLDDEQQRLRVLPAPGRDDSAAVRGAARAAARGLKKVDPVRGGTRAGPGYYREAAQV